MLLMIVIFKSSNLWPLHGRRQCWPKGRSHQLQHQTRSQGNKQAIPSVRLPGSLENHSQGNKQAIPSARLPGLPGTSSKSPDSHDKHTSILATALVFSWITCQQVAWLKSCSCTSSNLCWWTGHLSRSPALVTSSEKSATKIYKWKKSTRNGKSNCQWKIWHG